MGVTININGLSLCHKDSGGIATATVPDVCKTPSPGGPVPIPYPNIARSIDLAKGTKTVKVDGGNMAAIKGSEFGTSKGDEPGTVGGIKSGVNRKEATWISYSFDVKFEGRNACRLTDKMLMNHGNAMCAQGLVNPPIFGPPTDPKCKSIYEKIFEILYAVRSGPRAGEKGLAFRWAEYAQQGSPRGPRPDGRPSTFMDNHIKEYRKHQDRLKKELRRWKKNGCDDKNDGNGEAIDNAKAYADYEPEWASGRLMPSKEQIEAAVKAVAVTAIIVGGVIVISRLIRLIPPLLPLQLSPI